MGQSQNQGVVEALRTHARLGPQTGVPHEARVPNKARGGSDQIQVRLGRLKGSCGQWLPSIPRGKLPRTATGTAPALAAPAAASQYLPSTCSTSHTFPAPPQHLQQLPNTLTRRCWGCLPSTSQHSQHLPGTSQHSLDANPQQQQSKNHEHLRGN
ncbi:hypothetical protein VDGL01_09368 [Verticillium dahliae]